MLSFKVLSIVCLSLYSAVYAASLPSGKMATCEVQVTTVCPDLHKGCEDGLFLDMTTKGNQDYNLEHRPLPGNSAMYQSKDYKVTVQVDDPFTFVGRTSIKLKSSLDAGFKAAVILYNEEDGKAHGLTYKLSAKTATDPEVRFCHHQLPKGYSVANLRMVQAMEDVEQ